MEDVLSFILFQINEYKDFKNCELVCKVWLKVSRSRKIIISHKYITNVQLSQYINLTNYHCFDQCPEPSDIFTKCLNLNYLYMATEKDPCLTEELEGYIGSYSKLNNRKITIVYNERNEIKLIDGNLEIYCFPEWLEEKYKDDYSLGLKIRNNNLIMREKIYENNFEIIRRYCYIMGPKSKIKLLSFPPFAEMSDNTSKFIDSMNDLHISELMIEFKIKHPQRIDAFIKALFLAEKYYKNQTYNN